jgi:hypothetical protein
MSAGRLYSAATQGTTTAHAKAQNRMVMSSSMVSPGLSASLMMQKSRFMGLNLRDTQTCFYELFTRCSVTLSKGSLLVIY